MVVHSLSELLTGGNADRFLRAHHLLEPVEGYLVSLDLAWDPADPVHCPTAAAAKEGRAHVVEDVATRDDLSWCVQAVGAGYRSLVSLPLTGGDGAEVCGALPFRTGCLR